MLFGASYRCLMAPPFFCCVVSAGIDACVCWVASSNVSQLWSFCLVLDFFHAQHTSTLVFVAEACNVTATCISIDSISPLACVLFNSSINIFKGSVLGSRRRLDVA